MADATKVPVCIELPGVRLYQYDAAFDQYAAVRFADGQHVTIDGCEAREEMQAMFGSDAAEAEAHQDALCDAANAFVSPVDGERY